MGLFENDTVLNVAWKVIKIKEVQISELKDDMDLLKMMYEADVDILYSRIKVLENQLNNQDITIEKTEKPISTRTRSKYVS